MLSNEMLLQAQGPSERSSATAPIKLMGNIPASLNSSNDTENTDTVNVTGAKSLKTSYLWHSEKGEQTFVTGT